MAIVINVRYPLRAGATVNFIEAMNHLVLPVLRMQPGFRHHLALVKGNTAFGVNVWEDSASADQYYSSTFREVVLRLLPLLEGHPDTQQFELATSTLPVERSGIVDDAG